MILLIEDEEILRFSFTTFLTEAGHSVRETDTIKGGSMLLNEETPHLVLCDILLPDGNGIDFLKRVHERFPHCPVIMITGQPSVETAARAVRYGAHDYLIKPVTKDVLLHAVKKALELHTAKKEQEQARREKDAANRDVEAIFSSVTEGIITVDDELKILRANEAIGSICQCLPDTLVGAKLDELELSCSRGCLQDVKKILKGERPPRPHQIECHRKDQPDQVVLLTSSCLARENGAKGGILVIHDLTRQRRLEKQVQRSRYDSLIGESEVMRELYSLLDDLKGSDATVLITGESGTGKELVAQSLHRGSRRKAKPFVRVNCSALSESLLESELFGHVRGAFTGAIRDKEGRFEAAQGGTLLLDEIGDISPTIQLKLLRVLQEKVIERVGANTPIPVDVRIIAATNRDLRRLMNTRQFRQDLYYRLNVVGVHLPPLRERLLDIPLLTNHFIERFNRKTGKNIQGCSDELLTLFQQYPWPGNVRELEHAIEHGFVLCHDEFLSRSHLPQDLQQWHCQQGSEEDSSTINLETILQTIEASGGNKALAARKLGISRRTIYRKLQGDSN